MKQRWQQFWRPAQRLARPLPAAWLALAGLLLLQGLLNARIPQHWGLERCAGAPPDPDLVRLLSLGETQLAGYATALSVQGFDAQAGALLPLPSADLRATRAWLQLAFALNPKSGYPLMLAAFDYARAARVQDVLQHSPQPQAPAMLQFVEQGFRADPAVHWPWLVQALWVARFDLHDEKRALAEAQMLRNSPASAGIPQWARELDSSGLREAARSPGGTSALNVPRR